MMSGTEGTQSLPNESILEPEYPILSSILEAWDIIPVLFLNLIKNSGSSTSSPVYASHYEQNQENYGTQCVEAQAVMSI